MSLTTTIKLDLSAFTASLQDVAKKATATAADIQQAFAKGAKIDIDTTAISSGLEKAKKAAEDLEKAQKAVNQQQGEVLRLAKQGLQGSEVYINAQNELKARREILNTLKESAKAADNLNNETKKIGDTAQKSGGLMSKIKEGMSGSSIANMAGAFTVAGAITKGAELAVNAVKGVIDIGMKYETAMADLSAITGVSGEQLNQFGDKAKDLAKQFGGSTIDQISSFKGVLSRLGPDIAKSPEALDAMTMSINTLAKASGITAATSMDALATATLQFGVDLSDPIAAAKEMDKMINVMAAGAKEGASEVPQIAEALKVSGAMSKSANVSFEELNGAIQVLATRSKVGSEAGVALRNVMTKLAAGRFMPKDVLDGLNEAGVNIAALSNKSLTLEERLKALKPIMKDDALVAKLFGDENIVAGKALLDQADAIGVMTKKVTGTNVAYEQAAINMNTMAERISRLKAWIETFAIDTYQGFMSIVTPIAGFVTDLLANTIVPFFEGIFNGIIDGFKPLYDAVISLWNEISKLFQTSGEGVDVWKILKDVASTLGNIVGGVLKIAIQAVTIGIRTMVEVITWLVKGVNYLIDAFKNFINSGNPVANFIKNLWQNFKDLIGTIGGVIEKVLQFLGILKGDDNKAPLKKQIIVETKATTTTEGGGTAEGKKDGDKKDGDKKGGGSKSKKEDSNIKYQQEINADIIRGEQDLQKKVLEENIQALQQRKDNILNDTAITEQERLKLIIKAEEDIELQKLDIALLGLEQRYKADLAQEEKKFQDLKKAGKVTEESERLHQVRIKQIDLEYEAEFMKEVAKNDTALNKNKVENAKKTAEAIKKAQEESKKNYEQEAKEEDEFITEGIKRKFRGEEQKYQLALYSMMKEYRAGTITEEEYLARKLEMYKEYLYQTNTLYRMSMDFKDAIKQAFSQKENKQESGKIKEEISSLNDQEKALKESLNKREITKKEFNEKLKELEKQRHEKEEQLEEKSFSLKKGLLKSFQLLFEKTLKDRAVTESNAEKKHAAIMSDQTSTDEQRFKASTDLLATYGATAAVQLGEVLATGKATMGDVLVVVIDAATKMLTAMIPVWVAGIMGTSTSQMGVWGLVVAAGLIALVTGLAAAAKSSLSSAKGGAARGYMPGVQGYTEPAGIDTELVAKSPLEAILTEQMTAENSDVLDYMFKTKKSARDYFAEGGFGMSMKPQYAVPAQRINPGRGDSIGAEIVRALSGMNGNRNSKIGVEVDINGKLTNAGDIMVFAERQRAKNLKTF